jgi:hypothetical protein
MTTKTAKPTSRKTAPKPSEVAVPRETETPFDPALSHAIDELEAFINRAMSGTGRQHEKVADRVFGVLYEGDVAAALAVRVGNAPKYDALARRAGSTLLMDTGTLSRVVRIGALNHRLEGGPWGDLNWAQKVELLPLLRGEQDFELLARGIAFASLPGHGRDAIREWVAGQRRPEGGQNALEREAPTPRKARKMLEIGTLLVRVAERRELAVRVRRMAADDRREWMAALERALKSLGRLHEELNDNGED